jgi:hypothetical protein
MKIAFNGRDGRFGRYFLNLIACTNALWKQNWFGFRISKHCFSEGIEVEKKRPKRPWSPNHLFSDEIGVSGGRPRRPHL